MGAQCLKIQRFQSTRVCCQELKSHVKNQERRSVKRTLELRPGSWKVVLTVERLIQEKAPEKAIENPKVILKKETIWTDLNEKTQKFLGEKLNLDYRVRFFYANFPLFFPSQMGYISACPETFPTHKEQENKAALLEAPLTKLSSSYDHKGFAATVGKATAV
jgi:hypothetical protein